MSEQTGGLWHLPDATPAAILDNLPAMGKLMAIHSLGGVTHERIGPVAQIRADQGTLQLDGACHNARLDPAQVARVVLDTTSVMGGKTYPRLAFQDGDAQTIFAVVGMAGLDPFEAALADLPRAPLAPPARPDRTDPPAPDPDDPGRVLLDRFAQDGVEVEISVTRPGLTQSWTGGIAEVKPAMGFANIMTADFHLHLKDGSVARWQGDGPAYAGLDAAGAPIGLTVRAT